MALTDSAVRNAKAGSADRKLADEKGLYLFITVGGSKLWRFKYRLNGKEKKLAFGAYPDVQLKEARARRDAARRQIEEGVDPAQAKRDARAEALFGAGNSFSAIAKEYIAKIELEGRSEVTIAKTHWLLSKLSPALGTRPIAEIAHVVRSKHRRCVRAEDGSSLRQVDRRTPEQSGINRESSGADQCQRCRVDHMG